MQVRLASCCRHYHPVGVTSVPLIVQGECSCHCQPSLSESGQRCERISLTWCFRRARPPTAVLRPNATDQILRNTGLLVVLANTGCCFHLPYRKFMLSQVSATIRRVSFGCRWYCQRAYCCATFQLFAQTYLSSNAQRRTNRTEQDGSCETGE
jgi:hypothetical protein